jgi:hypothetical protein
MIFGLGETMRTLIFRALAAVCLLLAVALSAGAAEIRLDSEPTCLEQKPDIAALPGGGFVAVWQQGRDSGINSRPRVFARLFGPDMVPLGTEFQVNGDVDGFSPEVAVNAAGHFIVVWRDGADKVRSRAYGPTGNILGPEWSVTSSAVTGFAVTATRAGGFAVVTTQTDWVALWRFGSIGEPQGIQEVLSSVIYGSNPHPTFEDPAVAAFGPSGVVTSWSLEDREDKTRLHIFGIVSSPGLPMQQPLAVLVPFVLDDPAPPRTAVAANAAGQILAVWEQGVGAGLRARVFTADREPLDPAVILSIPGSLEDSAPDAAATPSGDFLVAWQNYIPTGEAQGRIARIGADGQLAEPPSQLWDTLTSEGPSLTVGPSGQVVVAWQSEVGDHPSIPVCTSTGLHALEVGSSSDVLRLREGRFEVRVSWTDHAGNSGQGRAARLTDDSGSFWFFGEENVELVVKVLDGRAVNGSFWVFYASLTDVEFTLEVTDTATWTTRTYENPAGRLAGRADTAAFPSSGAAGVADIAGVAARSHLPGSSSSGDGPCTRQDLPVVRRPGLCLGDRFEVEVAWHANGGTGDAAGVGLTGDSGYFWFFGQDNIELVVKVLDGRGVNGHFWVFYGALTDVEYTVQVRDTVTGQVKTYHNPAGQLRSRADTAAF